MENPCVCTEKGINKQDIWGCFVDGKSLRTGNGTSCSMLHCRPEPLLQNEADDILKHFDDKDKLTEIYENINNRIYS